MDTTVESLEGNKVKLHVTIPEQEFERAIDQAFKKLAREVRIPGFRPGKAPRQLLEARLGTDVAREQALRDSLPEYYVDAVTEHQVDVIDMPDIEITSGQEEGDVSFEAVVEVRPTVRLDGYEGLEVELPIKPVDDEAIESQVDALRERFADLTDSEDPLIDDAYATIDITGTVDDEPLEGLTASDFLYRVGSAMVVPELDEELRGTRPGAILEFTSTLEGERFGEFDGAEVTFRVVVKDAKRKVLPEVTDEWAGEASEFDTVDELRDDIRQRLETMQKLQGQMALRDKVLEQVADLVPVAAPSPLIDQEVRRRVEDLAHRLSHQGVNLDQYLSATGQDPQAFLDEMKPAAEKAVLADLALRAVVDAEEISASDEELDAELERLAERTGEKVAKLRRELDKRGSLEAVRSEIARGKALEFLVDHARVVDEEGQSLDLSLPAAPEASAEAAPDAEDASDTDSNDEPASTTDEAEGSEA